MIDHYDWPGGREAMIRFGPATGPIVVAVLPLFEEANRTRTFVVTILRMLAERGIASALPDLPGTGESLVPLETLPSTLEMEEGYESAVDGFWQQGRKRYGIAFRSGALLDRLVTLNGRWHFAPQDAADLLRDLKRIKQASLGPERQLTEFWQHDGQMPGDVPHPPVEIAGNLIAADFLTNLKVDVPLDEEDGPLRIVRLETDPRPADRHVPGAPLWRRAEPDNDPALAALLADDIAAWVRQCEG